VLKLDEFFKMYGYPLPIPGVKKFHETPGAHRIQIVDRIAGQFRVLRIDKNIAPEFEIMDINAVKGSAEHFLRKPVGSTGGLGLGNG
jgi:hypothetical protein